MSFTFRAGTIPLLISFPHNGTLIPDDISKTMTSEGTSSKDTDWFLDRLYDFPELCDASHIVAEYSRYVIDLNRSADDRPLYPGQTTTGLAPESRFDGAAIYTNDIPEYAEIARRVEKYWQPYHEQIRIELSRMLERHGIAVLLDAHSIASVVPLLFEGALPDFNFGTNHGASCDQGLASAVWNVLESQSQFSRVHNGRFVGGYITRHYGQPEQTIHALQIELSQATYLNESDLTWSDSKAAAVQPVFRQIITAIRKWLAEQNNIRS